MSHGVWGRGAKFSARAGNLSPTEDEETRPNGRTPPESATIAPTARAATRPRPADATLAHAVRPPGHARHPPHPRSGDGRVRGDAAPGSVRRGCRARRWLVNAAHGAQAEVIAFLSDPQTHGQPVQQVETHSAIVFLSGRRALKLKRAVRYSYLDFSTLDRRRRACEAEVATNRRTAPALYTGVVAVTRNRSGGLEIGGQGPVV